MNIITSNPERCTRIVELFDTARTLDEQITVKDKELAEEDITDLVDEMLACKGFASLHDFLEETKQSLDEMGKKHFDKVLIDNEKNVFLI
ncbi:hypothetical protein PG999_004433 [Apiospora kogelbergensis]|uniref:Uncharacterized protein n=1 Tax=Apiospora kogelbergensis TaxID=1337665 RepID=A0AAW0QZC8_9PEZI